MGRINGRVLGLELMSTGSLSEYGRRFNLVIVAEGYGGGDLERCRAKFKADAQRVVHQLATTAPFMDHMNAFNIFLLHVYSEQEGADRGTTLVNTYFDAAFPGTIPGSELPLGRLGRLPQLLLVDEKLVHETVAAQLVALSRQRKQELGLPHKIIVLVNTRYDGGSGGNGDGIAVASHALDFRTVLHELGHTFGLVDEYPPGLAGFGPNLSNKHDPLPWEGLAGATPQPTVAGATIDFETVGAFTDPDFEYANYRSQWLCRMRYCFHAAFCEACSSHVGGQLETFSP